MPKSYRAPNKRIIPRAGNGRFRKPIMQDFGIGGFCPVCSHLLIRHYDGDTRDTCPDPRKFRFRCFTCEPLTETEKQLQSEIGASKPKQTTIMDMLNSVISSESDQ